MNNNLALTIVAAIGKNNEMGKDGGLMWHLPHDMKRFQKITSGHTMVMGRKTYLSLPSGALPNRRHIVLSRDPSFEIYDGIIVRSVQEALAQCNQNKENFVIGGASVYEAFLPYVNRMYLTHIHASFEGADTYFPSVDYDQWKITDRVEMPADGKHPYAFTYMDYILK